MSWPDVKSDLTISIDVNDYRNGYVGKRDVWLHNLVVDCTPSRHILLLIPSKDLILFFIWLI